MPARGAGSLSVRPVAQRYAPGHRQELSRRDVHFFLQLTRRKSSDSPAQIKDMDLIFIIILVMTSVVAVTFIIERGIALRWVKVIPPRVGIAVENYRSSSDLPQMQSICRQNPSPIARLLLFTTEHLD